MNFSQQVIPGSPKKWNSSGKMIIVVIVTLIVAFVVFSNLGRLWSLISGTSQQSGASLQLGQSISLTGNIVQHGDYVNYTHTISVPVYGTVGLKSKTIDLNQYTGMVQVNGVVEKKFQETMYIVEVTSVSGSQVSSLPTTSSSWVAVQWQYFAQWGVYFPTSVADTYIVQASNDGNFAITNKNTQKQFSLHAFVCSSKDPSTDCTQLLQTIGATAEKKFTDSHGLMYYKMEGVNSWLIVPDSSFGYLINDATEQDVRALSSLMVMVNSMYVKETMLTSLTSLCANDTTQFTKVTSTKLSRDSNGLLAVLQGTITSGTATCKIVLDPSSSLGWQKLSFTPSILSSPPSPSPSSSSTSSTSSTPSGLDFSVKQFPISLDKTMIYVSSRGHTITFPSRSISYGGVSLDEDLSSLGLHCTSQLNVVAFANKPSLASAPALKIFECTSKRALTLSSDAYRQIVLSDGRIFILKIIDPSWKAFSDNVSIQLTQ